MQLLQLQHWSVGVSMVDVGSTTTVHGVDVCSLTVTAWLAFGTKLSHVKSEKFLISIAVEQSAAICTAT